MTSPPSPQPAPPTAPKQRADSDRPNPGLPLPPGGLPLLTGTLTGGLVLGLLGSRAIAQTLIQLGLASEEIFRGERLPTLPSPPP